MSWSDQLATELHKPVIRKFPRRRIYVPHIDHTWAADLVDMREFSKWNKGIKYILTVIDIFSRFGWMVPLKDKSGKATAEALKHIISTSKRKPKLLWVDKGKEFYNKDVKALVDIYSTENEEKSSVIERYNRTMKEAMWKYFSSHNTNRYSDVLKDLVKQYNNKVHSSIGMSPTNASLKRNEKVVYNTLYEDIPMEPNPKQPKFKLGDLVRIPRIKKHFEKGYTPRWTEELFSIDEILYTTPLTYRLVDLNEEEVKGTFYEQELQKSDQQVFRIEKVLRRKGKKALVKWLGYPESFNSWVSTASLKDLSV